MAATTSYGVATDYGFADAQHILDTHVTSSADGRCLACGVPGPCWRREVAVVIFWRSLRLPRRAPGATRPELIRAKRAGSPSLFQA